MLPPGGESLVTKVIMEYRKQTLCALLLIAAVAVHTVEAGLTRSTTGRLVNEKNWL